MLPETWVTRKNVLKRTLAERDTSCAVYELSVENVDWFTYLSKALTVV